MKIVDLKSLPGAKLFKWDRNYLFRFLTTGNNPVLTDPKLIAAVRYLDRKDFVPQNFKEKAYEDLDLDIGFNETITRPSVIVKAAELLKPKAGGRYLDIGTGSGYMAMLLGFVAANTGKVFTIERVQWLWEMARSNGSKYLDIKNVTFLYRDGLEGLPAQAPFDGIHIAFAVESIPENLKMQLAQNGARLVCPTVNNDLRVVERNGTTDFTEEIIPGFVFKEGQAGVS